MEVHYTGRHVGITDAEKDKAARKFEKVHRMLSAHQDLEAHVVFSKSGTEVEAEVTLRALHHTLVVTDVNDDAFTALNHALSKLEKQARKNKDKLIATRRPQRQRGDMPAAVAAVLPEDEAAASKDGEVRVVTGGDVVPKPITLEEARIVLDQDDADQVTYRDLESGRLCVLLRRRDGHLELVETPA